MGHTKGHTKRPPLPPPPSWGRGGCGGESHIGSQAPRPAAVPIGAERRSCEDLAGPLHVAYLERWESEGGLQQGLLGVCVCMHVCADARPLSAPTPYREGRKMNMRQNLVFATPRKPHPGHPILNQAYLDQLGGCCSLFWSQVGEIWPSWCRIWVLKTAISLY